MAFQVDALTQRPATAPATVSASSRGRGALPPTTKRRELRCPDCGFGAVVAHPLRRCPMCGGGEWQLIQVVSESAGAEFGRS